jgi:hypothetical protein
MSIRPAGVDDGSRPTQKIPTVARVSAAYGSDPSRIASSVQLSFAPTDRHLVDEAVAAFRETIEARR